MEEDKLLLFDADDADADDSALERGGALMSRSLAASLTSSPLLAPRAKVTPVSKQVEQLQHLVADMESRYSKSIMRLENQIALEIRNRFILERKVMHLTEQLLRVGGTKVSDVPDLTESDNMVLVDDPNALLEDMEHLALAFDDIEIGDELGAGGFADVYKATFRGTEVAVKNLRVEALGTRYLSSLKREVSLLAQLPEDAPYIIHLHGVVTFPSHYIVLELCELGELARLLRKPGFELPWLQRVAWARQVATALAYLHALQPPLIHMDVKTQNVLVKADMEVRLIDFGLARRKDVVLPEDAASQRLGVKLRSVLTASGGTPSFLPPYSSVRGTPFHIAPEVLRHEPWNEAVDVYSFGMVLWELLTRERASRVASDSVYEREAKRSGNEQGWTPPIPAWAPTAYRDLLVSCWSHGPLDRPDACEVVKTLQDIEAVEVDVDVPNLMGPVV